MPMSLISTVGFDVFIAVSTSAAELKLVNYAVPKEKLREETIKLANKLMEKNPAVLRAAKEVYKYCRTMDYAQAEEYMSAKGNALRLSDPEKGRETGMKPQVSHQ